MIQGSVEMTIVGPTILCFNGIDRNLVILYKGGSYIVLCGKWVGSTEDHLGPSGLQGTNQVCRLCGNVETSGKTEPS
jgi:hypothetical protein